MRHTHTQTQRAECSGSSTPLPFLSVRLGTKLMRLVKDRGRMEQLAAGGAGQLASRVRDVEMEEMIEELQDKVRTLQMENQQLKQRLLVSKQQLFTAPRRTLYGHVQPRVNTGLKRLSDATAVQSRPKSILQGFWSFH